MKLRHLARRFAGSFSRRPADDAWAESHLNAGERALWRRMPLADRRHAVGVAHAVPPEVIPAALLHDVGKIESGLGPFARAGATVVGFVRRDVGGRVGRYLRHDAIGAQLLRDSGSDGLTVAWAAEHHLPPERWTVPRHLGDALKAADDD